MADNESKTVETPATEAPAKVQKSLGRKIAAVIGIILIVLAAVIGIVLWQIDRIVASGTRTVGSMLTGTKVDIKGVSIRPFAGAVILKDFTVGNPEGFLNPEAIKVGKFHVDAGMRSLTTDKIEVEHLELSGVGIDFEYAFRKGSNLSVILANVEKATGADKKKKVEKAPEENPEKKASQKQVVIRKLILRDAKVTVSSGVLKTTMVIPLIPIEMENVGEGKDLAGTIAEVMSRIILEVGNAIAKAGNAVVDGGGKVVDATGDALKSVGNAAGDAVKSAGNAAGDAVKSVGNAAGDAVNAAGGAVNSAIDSSVNLIKKLPGLGK